MKKLLGIVVLGLLWCSVGIAAEREPGTDKKCLYVFEKENIFEKKFLPKVNKSKGVFVTYVGCNKYYDDWSWDYSFRVYESKNAIDEAHKRAFKACAENEMPKYNLTGCHLFSIDDVIVWGKDAAFVAKVEKDIKTRLAKINKEKEKEKKIAKKKTKSKKNKLDSADYVQEYLFWNNIIFEKNNPTTFKKLTFKKEKKTADVAKRVKYSANWNKKKFFRSFNFIAEYEDNITVEILVEYEKDKKDFEKAEEKALFYSKMYGQMPHFLKTHNKKIYIHNDFAESHGTGTWWVMFKKLEFHINPKNCKYTVGYSHCAVVMVHELAHVIQQLTGVIRPSKWMKARKLDKKKYASEYAKTNAYEDFAESLTAWVVVRYKSNKISKSDIKKFNRFIPNRFKLFDEMNFNMYPL